MEEALKKLTVEPELLITVICALSSVLTLGIKYVFDRWKKDNKDIDGDICLLYTSPSPRDKRQSRMPSSA